jgi:coiled-coil domain-containing protein 39
MTSGEETKKMIEKFCRMDAGRAEALDSKRKLLHEAIVKQTNVLVNAYEEKKALELLLERTSQLYRQAHLERRQLVNTWKDAVNQMNQREGEIKETEAEIENAKKVSGDKLSALKREEMVMKLKQDENKDTEYYIQELNITSSDLRNRLLKLEDSIGLKSSEVLALKKTVISESQKLNHLRSQNRQMLVDEKEKENTLMKAIEELKLMREKFQKFKNNNSNAQERLRQIEEMFDQEKKNMKTIQDETARLNSTLYRSEQQLKKLQEAERSLMLECQTLETGIARTRASCKNLEKELLRQTEILYNVDYNIQHAEMRLANMRGTVDEEETKRLENRRKRLEKIYEDKMKAEDLMKTQIARIEEDMRKLSTVFQNSIAEFERIVS